MTIEERLIQQIDEVTNALENVNLLSTINSFVLYNTSIPYSIMSWSSQTKRKVATYTNETKQKRKKKKKKQKH